jgi:hypothetical protein
LNALTPIAVRNVKALAAWLHRKAEYLLGPDRPDPRDQALKDRGADLEWRARIARRRLEKAVGGAQ